MASLLTHVYFIQNLLNRGVPSDDVRLSNRLVAHALKQARSKLIKQKLNASLQISESNYQRICVPLELHTYHDCDCITDNEECKILRSTLEIPEYMVGRLGSILQVKNLNGTVLSEISITSNDLSKYSLTAHSKIGYFIDDSRLYILNNIKLKSVIVKAIWEDPEEVDAFNEEACPQLDSECIDDMSETFPIDAELTYPMYQLTVDLLGYAFTVPEDTRNDGKAVEAMNAIDPNETR